jgi:hypothetical protein
MWPMLLFVFLSHKRYDLLNYTQLLCYVLPKNLTYTVAGFEPGSSVPEADAMATVPFELLKK